MGLDTQQPEILFIRKYLFRCEYRLKSFIQDTGIHNTLFLTLHSSRTNNTLTY